MMKQRPSQCYLCGALAIWTCGACGKPICEEHGRLGIDARGKRQYLCLPCDDRQQQGRVVWRGKR